MPRHPLLPILTAGALLAGVALLLYRPKRPAPHSAPEVPAVWATDVNDWGPGELRVGQKATGPLPGQKRPPCEPRLERELAGACWQPHLERPPCPPGLYEGAGMCLMPVKVAKRPDTSVRQ